MKRTAIIVDDEPITRLDVKSMLEDIGIEVIGEASDGFDAIEECKKHNPDIVIMDINMPVFDGQTASRTLLAENLCNCIIMLTAYSDKELIKNAVEAGVTGYLVKPITAKQLLPTIEIALRQSLINKENKNKIAQLNLQIQNNKKIEIAKGIIAKSKNIAEVDAYKLIHKMSMDKRVSIIEIANKIIDTNPKRIEFNNAKDKYVKVTGVSEKSAYTTIINYMKLNKCSAKVAVENLIKDEK